MAKFNRRIQLAVDVELIPELGLTSDEQARDMLEEAIRNSGVEEMMRVASGVMVIEVGDDRPRQYGTAEFDRSNSECSDCKPGKPCYGHGHY